MAHFAKISESNLVLNVVTVTDSVLLNENNVETESLGQQWLETHNNWPAHLWIQTSYNTAHNTHSNGGTPFRGNYAGIGFTWDSENQIFWHEQPYPSWVKNNTTALWESPIGNHPELTETEISDFVHYIWNETDQVWNKRFPKEE